MQSKSTFVLLILVLATGGYMLAFERGSDQGAAYRKLDAQAIRFSPKSVSSFRLKKDALELEFLRTDAKWTLSYPVMARVSMEQLDRMMTGLASLKRNDVVPVEGLADFNQYGFDAPRATLLIADSQGTKTWLIGRDAPLGTQVYIMEEGGTEAVVTDVAVLGMLPTSVDDVRDRSIFPRGMAPVNRIDIRRKAGFLQLGADVMGGWRIQQPIISSAENGAVAELLDAVFQTRIEKFVADEVTDMTSYGLQDPQAQIMLSSGEDTGVGLLIGNPLPDNPALVYAKQTEEYAIFAVSTNVLEYLRVDADQLRDRRLLPMDLRHVRQVSLERAGNGTLTLNLATNGLWEVTQPRRWAANPETMGGFLSIWQSAQIDKFVELVEENDDPRGALAMTLTFAGESVDEQCVLAMYHPKSPDAPALCSRAGEDLLFAYNSAFLKISDLTALDFKSVNVLSLVPENVSKITQVMGANTVVLARDGAGAFAEASPVAIKKLWKSLNPLDALTYVKENPESLAEYGLDHPQCRLTLSLKDSDEIGHVLIIGATCPGGNYAMLQGADIVFIMTASDTAAFCGDLKGQPLE